MLWCLPICVMKEQAAWDVLLLFACLREKGMAKPATMMLGDRREHHMVAMSKL
jgi:hypothetical protein